jgi:hypothetical protein
VWLFRYKTLKRFEISALTQIQVDGLQLPSLSFEDRVPEDLRSFRTRRELDDFRHPGFPDDLATVYGASKELRNGMTMAGDQIWKRVQRVIDDTTFRGILLNQPTPFFPGQKGDAVIVRVLAAPTGRILASFPAPKDS